MNTLLTVLLSLLTIWIVSRVLSFSRFRASTSGTPWTLTLAPPFHVSNVFLPKSLSYDMPQVWSTKFDRYRQNGSTALFASCIFGGAPNLLLADATAIKEIAKDSVTFGKQMELYFLLSDWGSNLIASEHAEWRRHRKLIAPTFSESNNKLVWDQCLRICDQWFEVMDKNAKDGVYDEPDIASQTMRLALMVIASAAFGKELPWIDEVGEEVGKGHKMSFGKALDGLMKEFLIRVLVPKWAYFLPIKRVQDCAAYYSEFELYVKEMIQERRAAIALGNEIDDVFSILIKESDKEEGEGSLSEGEILSNIYVILLAGHETTGHSLAAALLLLALYPETQAHLYAEAKEFIDTDAPQYSNFSSLKWATATINEVLRLFPPILTIPKRATVDTTLTIHTFSPSPSSPSTTLLATPTQIFIPAGTNIRMDACALQRNPNYWDEPDKFDPERFIDTEEKKWDRDAFIPFAVGQRACIGRSFAVVEATIVLAKIMLRYEVAVPDHLRGQYAKKDHETEDGRVKRIYNALHAITLTPGRLGISFRRRDTSP